MRGRILILLFASLLGCLGQPPTGNKSNATDCICPTIYQPVCGADGKTYDNSCVANCAGINISRMGACASCTDSDGGKNSTVKGTVSADGVDYTDYCRVFESVEEYYCANAVVGKETIACPQGHECRDGACSAKLPSQPLLECIDTDGDDIYVKGTVKAAEAEYNDSCTDYKTLSEYYCELGRVKNRTAACPEGFRCEAGRCFKPGATCTDTDLGDDIYNEGKVTVKSGLTSGEYLDKCIDEHTVREYYCDAGGHVSRDVECPQGYRCVQASCRQDLCIDSDDGYSIFQKGAVSRGNDIIRDKCTDDYSGVEYYCDNNAIVNATFTCPAGYACSDGKCGK